MPNAQDIVFDDGFSHAEFVTVVSGQVVGAGEILAQDVNYKWKAYADGDTARGVSLGETDASAGDAIGVVGFFGSYNKNNVYYAASDQFNGDASTKTFVLTKTASEVDSVTVDGIDTDYTFDESANSITFSSAPASGTNNIVVTYKAVPTDAIIQALRDKAIYLEEVKEY